jgi:hypothetical protein
MMNFFSKIFKGSLFSPPEIIIDALKERFHDVINIEWNKNGENFEAIFYKDNIEYIAVFDRSGVLLEYKMFLPEGFLPEKIKSVLNARGETMNAVMINKGNSVTYETIYRDKELIRYLMVFNELGGIIEEKVL